jgi:aspartate/methionine/tyrosine aminotransferase
MYGCSRLACIEVCWIFSALLKAAYYLSDSEFLLGRWLTKDYGVTTIPCSSFYDDKKPVTDLIRFAFCKTDDVLEAARDRLLKLKDRL